MPAFIQRTDAGDEQEEHLCAWGINGVGVGSTIDVGIDIEVAQEGEMSIGRNVAVGIDAGGLHLSIPHVAEDIGGKKGRRKETDQPASGSTDQDDGKGPAIHRPVEHHPHRHQIKQRLVHVDQPETNHEVLNLIHSLAAERNQRESQQDKTGVGPPVRG